MSDFLASNLRRLMSEHDIGPTELAEMANVGRSTVHRWLAGEGIREKQIERLAKVFKVAPDDIKYGPNPVNEEKLLDMIDLVEAALDKKRLSLTSRRKAKLIVLLYKRMDIPNAEDGLDEILELLTE